MMLIPGSDPSGTSDAEGCAGGVVDTSEAGAGFFGLVDVSSVVETEITEADAVVSFSVAEGIVDPGEPALFGVGVGSAALGRIIVGRLVAPEGKPVSDGFSV